MKTQPRQLAVAFMSFVERIVYIVLSITALLGFLVAILVDARWIVPTTCVLLVCAFYVLHYLLRANTDPG